MDKEYFLNMGIQPPSHFDPSPAMMWPSLPSVPEMNCSPEQSLDCFLNPNWDNSNSALSSIVSSCYTTPSNSPPKLNSPIKTPFLKSNIPNLQAVSADPGFAERAAKLSCFGSRSFNGRTSQSGLNTTELPPYGLSPFVGSVKLARVSSSPSLKAVGSPMGVQENKNFTKTQMEIRPKDGLNAKFRELVGYDASNRPEFASPNEGSSVSVQIPNGEIEVKTPSDSNFRKRKSISRGKSKEIVQTHSPNSTKAVDVEDYLNAKRCKSTESNGIENGSVKTEEEKDKGQKQDKADLKPAEPPKDYIHVRARRGQATDSHSLAERVRREKISERMKLLQDLVPGCNKVTGKALMLDEIINYVQSLQRQVELLSMKLASVNTVMDFDMGSLLSKDASHAKGCMPHSANPLDPLASPFFGQLKQEIPPTKTSFLNRAIAHCSVDPSDTTMCGEISMQLPFVDEVGQGFPQFSASFEDDLQSIVQMGFGQNPNKKPGLHSQSVPGSGETSHVKIEL